MFSIEVLEYIFSFTESDKDLARLARVCKHYHGASIHILWKDLDIVLPLFSLFPTQSLRINKNKTPVSKILLSFPPCLSQTA